MSNKRIAVITYSTVTVDSDNRMCVNRSIGKLLDQLSYKYSKVYYVASKSNLSSSLYDDKGNSIYNYHVKSSNVKFILVENLTKYSIFGRSVGMFNNLLFLIKSLKFVNYYYLTLPSFSNSLFALYLITTKKNVISYVGSNWDDTGPLRLNKKLYGFFSNFLFNLYLLIQNYIIKKSKFVLVTGNYLNEKYLNINSRTNMTVPMARFSDSNLKIKKKINTKKIKLLYVGRISKEKGFDLLIKAMNKLDKNFFLDAIGPIDNLMKENLNILKANSNINIVGYVNNPDNLKKYFREADLFIFLSKGEGFPRVLYEAMLSGLPIITSNIDTIKLSLGKKRAIFVDNNINDIISSINILVNDKKLYEELRNEGIRYSKNIFNKTAADQINELINKYSV